MAVRIRVESMVVGLCLTGVGVLWILANLGRVDFLSSLRTWWPVSLLVWGVLELLVSFVERARTGRS
jgi:hypothetical protein